MTTKIEDRDTAARHIDATEIAPDVWVYLPSEVNRHYTVTSEDLATLGRDLRAGAPDAYSLWCSVCGDESTDDEIAEYTGTHGGIMKLKFKVGDKVRSAPDSSDVSAMKAHWVGVIHEVKCHNDSGGCYVTLGCWEPIRGADGELLNKAWSDERPESPAGVQRDWEIEKPTFRQLFGTHLVFDGVLVDVQTDRRAPVPKPDMDADLRTGLVEFTIEIDRRSHQ